MFSYFILITSSVNGRPISYDLHSPIDNPDPVAS